MKKSFRDTHGMECLFNDEGITFYGDKQAVFFSYGCLDDVKMSLLGVLQANCRAQVCCFAVQRKDRAEMKEMLKFAKSAMKTAPKEYEAKVLDLTKPAAEDEATGGMTPEEELQYYKQMFIRGEISKDEYDMRKRVLKG